MKRIKSVTIMIGIFLLGIFSVSLYAQEMWQEITSDDEVFTQGYIQVTGRSAPGQNAYMALRAATLIAQRNLLEVIKGLRIYGTTTVKDGFTQSDIIKSAVEGFLRGAIRCGKKYYPTQGYAIVCMRVYLRGRGGIYDTLLPLLKEERILPQKGTMYMPKTQIGFTKSTRPHDGLIVDVREYSFRPALINRILTKKNEVIFDPSKIASAILIERGCGGFTTDMNKAKALLKVWGSNNPMTVKAIGVVKLTDVQVSDDDASAIFVQDKKTNFLAEAKVVFVLR